MRTSKGRATTARNPVPAVALATSSPSEAAAGGPLPTPLGAGDSASREALVRLVAYSFYERRGYIAGSELEDWLQAEMEVERQLAAGSGSAALN
jgi:hypothetical protein